MEKKIHVVAFQNPFPPTYGGVMDVYYKLRELRRAGAYIVLHAFVYGSRTAMLPELADVADEVYFYRRHTGLLSFFSHKPYITRSRRSSQLVRRLAADDAPVIFEGLHCCDAIDHPALAGRIKVLRAHNVEHDYYAALAAREKNLLKRIYFKLEARRLRRFEPRAVAAASVVAAVSEADTAAFRSAYPDVVTIFAPCFFNADRPAEVAVRRRFVLYHGNLSVSENIDAALRIITRISPLLPDEKFVIAGFSPDTSIMKSASGHPNVEVVDSPSPQQMDSLIRTAQVNLLITGMTTGIKLKLLGSLAAASLIVVNSAMIAGTSLGSVCRVADTDEQIADAIASALDELFEGRELPEAYNPAVVARKLLKHIGY